MRRKLAALFLGLIVPGALLPLFGDEAAKRLVERVPTERVNFTPGGVVRLIDSSGSLNVEGWDRSEVEITVTKSMERYYDPKHQERAVSALERVRIVADRRSDTELAISTILPPRLFARALGGKGGLIRGAGAALDKMSGMARHPLGGQGGLMLEYQIHVPRDSRLVIHHGTGLVLVSDVTGDVEATSRGGDILLVLPDSGVYSIDARSKLGTVSSDFAGDSHRRHFVGSGFARATPPPSHRIYVRTGMGGITIKAAPVEAVAPVGAGSR